jgi:CRISPR-associated protein (TIGR03984 family)
MKGQHSIQAVSIPANFASEPAPALAELARAYDLRWLLAHADDGVIWGELRADGLHLSGDAFPQISPPLRTATLQQARLFGPQAELLLWEDGADWCARLMRDGTGEDGEYYDETHLLWGNEAEQQQDGFVLLREGKEGLRHAPPLSQATPLPVRLQVRHYLVYDSDGQAYIAYSRLVAIANQGGEE